MMAYFASRAKAAYREICLWTLGNQSKHIRHAFRNNNTIIVGRIVSELMEEAKIKKQGSANDDGMREIFLRILENPALDNRDKKAAVIDFITAGIETVSTSSLLILRSPFRRNY